MRRRNASDRGLPPTGGGKRGGCDAEYQIGAVDRGVCAVRAKGVRRHTFPCRPHGGGVGVRYAVGDVMTAAEGFRVEYRAVYNDPSIHARIYARREEGDSVVGVLTMAAEEWAAFSVFLKSQGVPVSYVQNMPAADSGK
jgi:hypothetical protein